MIYGISTARAHLDSIVPNNPQSDEIDWIELVGWIREIDGTVDPVAFAGRYFLGAPNEAEIAAGAGFCLWAHGEATESGAPNKIVPLQRADQARQSAIGDPGLAFGFEDATALAAQLDLCLAVGDLEIVGTKQILVFLEVADGTALSIEYWASWATTLHDAILDPARLADRTGNKSMQPLVPAILCAFTLDDGEYLPEAGVRACLDQVGQHGFRTHCHGFWARRRADDTDPAAPSFDWNGLGEYRQPRPILGLELPYMQRIPVRYLRWRDGLDGLSVPEGPLRNTLSLITLDWPATGGDADPLRAVFTATDWRADKQTAGLLTEMPVQSGVDTSQNLTDEAECLRTAGIVVSQLPSAYRWQDSQGVWHNEPYRGTRLVTPLPFTCRIVGRYYSTADSTNLPKDLTKAEATELSSKGFQIATIWQVDTDPTSGQALVDHFLGFEQGKKDAKKAFAAAKALGQPSYTPVYFAVDFDVGDIYKGVLMPPMEDVLAYFQDVHRGYRDYLQDHPSTLYYVGCYAQADACKALYRAGLATHFWQPWAPSWGDNWRPFPHANIWQVIIEETVRHPQFPDMKQENAALFRCNPHLDIDVAWGDPGGFSIP